VRLILAFAAVLVLGGAAVIFGWQQSEISHLRAQLDQVSAAPAPSPLRRTMAAPTALSPDDRRFILSQYQDVLAGMNLPPGRAARLQDLLTKRIEVALDAQDAAGRAGYSLGSTEMLRAEGAAIAGVDRQIATLLGPEDDQHFNWLISGAQPAPPVPPPSISVAVNVAAPAPPEPVYAEAPEEPAEAYATYASAPAPYYYYSYPYAIVYPERRFSRGFDEERPRLGGVAAPRPPAFNGGGVAGARPSRRAR